MAGWRTERKDRGGTCPEVDGDIDAKKKHSFLGFNWQLSSVLNSICIGHIFGLLEFIPVVSFCLKFVRYP